MTHTHTQNSTLNQTQAIILKYVFPQPHQTQLVQVLLNKKTATESKTHMPLPGLSTPFMVYRTL